MYVTGWKSALRGVTGHFTTCKHVLTSNIKTIIIEIVFFLILRSSTYTCIHKLPSTECMVNRKYTFVL